jgi:hypothetical protein
MEIVYAGPNEGQSPFPGRAVTGGDGALMAAQAGIRVVPLFGITEGSCTCRYVERCRTPGKHPMDDDWQKIASNDIGKVSEWWHRRGPNINFGGLLGEDFVVVDIDARNEGSLSSARLLGLEGSSPVVKSGRGWHIWRTAPTGTRTHKLSKGIELRGAGHFVVLLGSWHVSGVQYQVAVIGVPEPVPTHLLNGAPENVSTKAKIEGPARQVEQDDPRAPQWVWDKAEELRTKPEGQRSEADLSFGDTLRNRGFDEREVLWFLGEYSVAERPGHRADYVRRTVATVFAEAPQEPPQGVGQGQPNEEQRDKPKGKHLILVKASSFTPRPVRFAWKERAPLKGITILAGKGSVGKSSVSIDLAAHASKGILRGEYDGIPVPSLFMTTEDDWESVLAPRLMVAGANLDLIHAVYVGADRKKRGLILPDDADLLGQAFSQSGARLAFIDPIMGHISMRLDTHKDHHVRMITEELDVLGQQHGAAIIGILHFTKDSRVTDIIARIMGSGAFTNAARSVLAVFETQDGERWIVHTKANWSAFAPTLSFEILPGEPFTNEDGELVTATKVRWIAEREDITRFNVMSSLAEDKSLSEQQAEVLTILAEGGPMSGSAVHKKRKDSEATDESSTRHILGRLLEKGYAMKMGRSLWTTART